MATRRSRIKGVLNIPARRKAGDPSKGDDLIKQDTAQINNNVDITSNENDTDDKNKILESETQVADVLPENASESVRNVLLNLQSLKTIPQDLTVSGINKLAANSDNVIRIDIEAPPSPTKINRTRIKAVPRLGQRRVSFSVGSASESEDDGRRQSSRHRNDSVCSLASNVDENRHQQATLLGKQMDTNAMDNTSITAGGGTVLTTSPIKKEFNCVIQRKCRRTEQARKLATAKRDFLHKFKGDKPPERHRLTMMDLIFYNPTSNPMPANDSKELAAKDETEANLKSHVEEADDGRNTEEEVDDPDDQDEAIAPQVTVNADGEIIIDEKSLLIENKSTVKGRQKMERTHLVDGDKNTGYGIYKRVKRTKDWTKNETLRFYKALNTIGTDFTLMVKLFPNRTRRELKMKFKKEERINHTLIDKAVLEPVQFDMRDLEADLEKELLKEKELELRKKEVSEARCVNKQQRLKKPLRRHSPEKTTLNKVDNITNKEPKAKQKVVNSVLEALEESDDENNTESEVEEEDEGYSTSKHNMSKLSVGIKRAKRNPNSLHIYKKTKLTRIDNLSTHSDNMDHNSYTKDDEESLEPGSLIIVANPVKDSKEPQYQIFMITPDKKKVPIDLPSDVVKNLAANAGDGAVSEKPDIILGIENNFTIAEEMEQNYTINEELEENNYTVNEENATITCDIEPLVVSSEGVEQIISTVIDEQIQSGGDILILPLD